MKKKNKQYEEVSITNCQYTNREITSLFNYTIHQLLNRYKTSLKVRMSWPHQKLGKLTKNTCLIFSIPVAAIKSGS